MAFSNYRTIALMVFCDLVRRDRERRSRPEVTMNGLRRIVDESRASGVGEKWVSDILAQAKKHAKASGRLNE